VGLYTHSLLTGPQVSHDSIRIEELYTCLIDLYISIKRGGLFKIDKICNKARLGKHLSTMFPYHKNLKQRDLMKSLLFNFSLE
jgi:hypothetical protein